MALDMQSESDKKPFMILRKEIPIQKCDPARADKWAKRQEQLYNVDNDLRARISYLGLMTEDRHKPLSQMRMEFIDQRLHSFGLRGLELPPISTSQQSTCSTNELCSKSEEFERVIKLNQAKVPQPEPTAQPNEDRIVVDRNLSDRECRSTSDFHSTSASCFQSDSSSTLGSCMGEREAKHQEVTAETIDRRLTKLGLGKSSSCNRQLNCTQLTEESKDAQSTHMSPAFGSGNVLEEWKREMQRLQKQADQLEERLDKARMDRIHLNLFE